MKKLLIKISKLFWFINNKLHNYDLSKEEIRELYDIVNLVGGHIDEKYYDELYTRAYHGDKYCLDLLLKIASVRKDIVCNISLKDCVSIKFRGDKQLFDGVNKIKEKFINNEQEIIVKGRRVFMKFWVFIYVFGENMLAPNDSPLEFDTDLTFIKLED